MAVDAIGVVSSSASATPQNVGISETQFLQLLLTQLQFQDPLKPVDNTRVRCPVGAVQCPADQPGDERRSQHVADDSGRPAGDRPHGQEGDGQLDEWRQLRWECNRDRDRGYIHLDRRCAAERHHNRQFRRADGY